MKAFLALCALVSLSFNVYSEEKQMTRLDLAQIISDIQQGSDVNYLECSTEKGAECRVPSLGSNKAVAKDYCIKAMFKTLYKKWIANTYKDNSVRGTLLAYNTEILNDEGLNNLKIFVEPILKASSNNFTACAFNLDVVDATLSSIVVEPGKTAGTGIIKMVANATYSDGSTALTNVSFKYPIKIPGTVSDNSRITMQRKNKTSGSGTECVVTIPNSSYSGIKDLINSSKTIKSIAFSRDKFNQFGPYEASPSSVSCPGNPDGQDVTSFETLIYGPYAGSTESFKTASKGKKFISVGEWTVATPRTINVVYTKDEIATAAPVEKTEDADTQKTSTNTKG